MSTSYAIKGINKCAGTKADAKNSSDWLDHFLLGATQQRKPDGRPLYAYKCSDESYEELKELCRARMKLAMSGFKALRLHPIFCLYAAETFRREHAGGPWAWQTIFEPLGLETPAYPTIAYWVEAGLLWWGRQLIYGASGDKERLLTIACEGGLPLRLLQNQSAPLTQFFRRVLEAYHADGVGGVRRAESIARQRIHQLPASLRQDVVIRLSGELIASVISLQQMVGATGNPISALDAKEPDWRNRLPLRIEEATAEALLTGLLRRSRELAQQKSARLRWRGWLEEGPQGWQVGKTLELPERLTAQQLGDGWTLDHPTKPRLRLLLRTASGTKAIAWLTLIQGSGASAVYQREWLTQGGVNLRGSEILSAHQLFLHDGHSEFPMKAQGGDSWGQIPWIFIEKGDAISYKWLAEGSARTSAAQAWVLASDGLKARHSENDVCDPVGRIPELGRQVYRVGGAVDFWSPEGDRYQVRCQATGESDESFLVCGDSLVEMPTTQTIYLGIPRIRAVKSDGEILVPSESVQWRPLYAQGAWHSGQEGCMGRIWLRLVEQSTGIERFRRQIDVLPKHFRLEHRIGAGTASGFYHLHGFENGRVEKAPGCAEGVRIVIADDAAEIECPPGEDHFFLRVVLLFTWPHSAPTEICLPYPQRGAVFQLAGRPLRPDDLVPLDRFGGLSVLLQDPKTTHFWLDGELRAADIGPDDHAGAAFLEHLPDLIGGRGESSLLPWQDRIASLLARSRDIEAHVRLHVATPGGKDVLARVRITRFDALIELIDDAQCVRISEDSIARLGPGWEARVHFDMIRLWSPKQPPEVLRACDEQPASWLIPGDLEPGPWWIMGHDGDWARFRPLLWVVPADPPFECEAAPASPLVTAIRETDPLTRATMIDAVLSGLGREPDHTDWPLLFDLIGLAREIPPSSLDPLRCLSGHPRTLALSLLRAEEETFDRVWSLAEMMPFSWTLIPVDDWCLEALRYCIHLRTALASLDCCETIVWDRFESFRALAAARRPYWKPLGDWLQERLFPEHPLKDSELLLARGAPQILESEIEQAELALLGRHGADEHWPQSAALQGWLGVLAKTKKFLFLHLDSKYRPVRCAPFVVAQLSLQGLPPSRDLIYELRLIRAFDPVWFDTAYAIGLTLRLAALPRV